MYIQSFRFTRCSGIFKIYKQNSMFNTYESLATKPLRVFHVRKNLSRKLGSMKNMLYPLQN